MAEDEKKSPGTDDKDHESIEQEMPVGVPHKEEEAKPKPVAPTAPRSFEESSKKEEKPRGEKTKKTSKKKKKGKKRTEQQEYYDYYQHHRPPPGYGYYGAPPPGYKHAPPPPGGYHRYQHPPPAYSQGDRYQRVYRGQYGSYNQYPLNQNDKLLAGLCYILVIVGFGWLVSLIVLLAVKPLSPWLKFHAIQSLVMNITFLVGWMLATILASFIIGLCCFPFLLVFLVYIIVVGVICFTGHDHRVPLIADWVEQNYI